jgi:hypothetical protein
MRVFKIPLSVGVVLLLISPVFANMTPERVTEITRITTGATELAQSEVKKAKPKKEPEEKEPEIGDDDC